MENHPLFSIVVPVKNSAEIMKNLLKSISLLNYPKEKIEVVVADGMSTDGTKEMAEEFGAKVVLNNKGTVSPGRNVGFTASKGDFIAFTDADCAVDRNWLVESVKYFEDKAVGCVGGPNYVPDEESAFGKAIGFTFQLFSFASGSVHCRELKRAKEVKSIPGCNAIYRRSALERVMPVDETLLTCDDTELNLRIRELGYKLLYAPDVFVWHHRRQSVKGLWRQIYRYAIGRLQFGKRRPGQLNFVHIAGGLSLIILPLLLLFFWSLGAHFYLYMGIAAFSSVFACAFLRTRHIVASALSPLVVFLISAAWSCGFLRELLFPMKDVRGK